MRRRRRWRWGNEVGGLGVEVDLVALGDLGEVVDLLGLPGEIVAEFGGEEGGDLGCGAEGGVGVEEEGAGASGEDIFYSASHFEASGPDDFGGEVGEIVIERGGEVGVFGEEELDGWGIGAVDGERAELGGVGVIAVDIEGAGEARFFGKIAEGGGVIDGVFRHVAIGGPFASGDTEEA